MPSNHKLTLQFSSKAHDDLIDIIQYTIGEYGLSKAETYNARLDQGFKLILKHPHIGKMREDIAPEYRVLRIEKHLIIYLPDNNTISIVRILHVNRDVLTAFSE